MPENNKHIKPYTAEDIQRYLNRQMTMPERHALEKAALEDPFLAEAIEGYMQHNAPALSSDIEPEKKITEKKRYQSNPFTQKKNMVERRSGDSYYIGNRH